MADSKKSKLFNKYLSRMATIKKEAYAAELFAGLEAGKNSYMRIDRLESSNFDMTWIKAIEDCIYEIGDIVANPKQVTKTVTGIVPVELARKTGAESVQHLASHTQYIKEISEEGDVVPNKILNIGSEEDIHTYENRFIATLIRRLVLFIEKRYEIIKKFSVLHDEEILYYKTKAIVDGSEVEIETKIKVKSESETEAAIQSNNYVNRIVKLREYILYFYGSQFMKELKTERDVRNPILMTNILRKNTKYHKCYELFRFLEKYDKLGVSYKLDEDASMFSDEELSELNTVMLTNYLALKARDRSKVTKGFSRTYKPRILTSIDDEQFIYGDLLRGPIEFLRIDEGYQKYLDEQLKKDLPPHPTKAEKEYYQEELEEKNTRKAEKAALDKLVKRKKKEQADFDRRAKAIIAQREKEEAERLAREADEARREEERRIEEVRQALVRDAKFGNDTNPESIEGESTVIEEENPAADIVEETPIEETLVEAEESSVEEIPEEEVVEEQLESEPEEVIEEPEAVEEQPQEVEEPPVEEPQEEIQPEEPVEEVPTVEEVVEEQLAEEEVPAEEQPTEPEQLSEEQVEEQLESPEEIEEVLEGEEIGVIEEPVAEEEPVEEAPAEEPAPEEDIDAIRQQLVADALSEEENVPEETPTEEPFVEEPVQEEEPQPAPEVVEEQPQEVEKTPAEESQEEPQPEEPIEEPKPAKKRRKRRKKVAKKQAEEQPQEVSEQHEEQVEEQPVEEAPTEEPVIEEPAESEPEEEPAPEEEASEEPEIEENNEIPEEKPTSAAKKPTKKRKKKKKATPKPKEEPAKIPGRFIVKTGEGYYVNSHKYSVYKHEAFVFDDFNAANKIKIKHGGKVVKL